ncbi:type II toxin-antitoxin system RelE/ParE family toxin [Aureimonas psammosilenae]|uniref:type II toxin-antitoxin system RelE/ParE family toxin n=1 Tax=Aureimonas psammosilenae TaxID=2495496 RepID=UPI0012609D07|nr:type II toxin-antitoxin system RelE/ParE family toxin [Aureimonas psammosilenae]
MTLAILRRPKAREDLIEIWSRIAEESEDAADRFFDRVEKILDMLGEHPQAGRSRSEIDAGLRSFPVANYVPFYRLADDTLIVTRVISGYRDLDGLDLR